MAQSNPYSSNLGAAGAGNVEDRVQSVKNKVEDAASTVASEGKKAYQTAERKAEEAYDATRRTAEDVYDTTRRFVRDQPVLAVGIAVTAAFAVGALWKLTQARRSEDLLDRVASVLEPQYRALRRRF